MDEDLTSTSLAQRIVLSRLVELSESGATPVNTAEIREAVTERLETVDIETVGHLTEADVMRALNGLAETALVDEQRPDDRSPAGKGRPEYSLSVDTEQLRKKLAEDDRLAPLFE